MAGACTGAALWSKRFGTSGESEKLDFATTDAAGNLYITGRFERDIDFGPAGILTDDIGDDETFVAKLDPSGVPIWARALRSRGYSRPIGIGVDAAGNVVVAGDAEVSINFGGDTTYESPEGLAFLVSWDAAGTWRYDRAEPRPLLNATTLAVAADGRVAMTGLFRDTIEIGDDTLTAANGGVFVAMYSAMGRPLWARGLDSAAGLIEARVAFDATTADLFLAVSHFGSIDFGGGSLQAPNNKPGTSLARVAAADGRHRWSKLLAYGTVPPDLRITTAPSGDVVLFSRQNTVSFADFGAGEVSGQPMVVQVHRDGTIAWGKMFTSTSAQILGAVVDSSGNVVLTGTFAGTLDLGLGLLTAVGSSNDAFFAKLSPTGAPLWARAVGDSDAQQLEQRGDAVVIGAADAPIVFGTFAGTSNFGDQELASGGGSDLFVAKLRP